MKEKQPGMPLQRPEDAVSRIFNCHVDGACAELARKPEIVAEVKRVLGQRLDCFQSQCVFKNPGTIGQPWHQDSHYFDFDRQPQVGVWIPLTRAGLDNGCLWVLPGSHRGELHDHVPDRRSNANAGYLEITDCAFDRAVPLPMEAGDVLFFDSFLMHKSADNDSASRRVALVLHYGRAQTRCRTSASAAALAEFTRWEAVSR